MSLISLRADMSPLPIALENFPVCISIKSAFISEAYSTPAMSSINRLTFDKILEIFNANQKSLSLEFNFSGSGLAIVKKNDYLLNEEFKIKNRLFTLKNLLKNL